MSKIRPKKISYIHEEKPEAATVDPHAYDGLDVTQFVWARNDGKGPLAEILSVTTHFPLSDHLSGSLAKFYVRFFERKHVRADEEARITHGEGLVLAFKFLDEHHIEHSVAAEIAAMRAAFAGLMEKDKTLFEADAAALNALAQSKAAIPPVRLVK